MKIIKLLLITFALSSTICAKDFTSLSLLNATDQPIKATLIWTLFNHLTGHTKTRASKQGEQEIQPQGIATFDSDLSRSEAQAYTAIATPTYFTITNPEKSGASSSYCLLHKDRFLQDSKINDANLLQFNGTEILKGNESVTHTWQYCQQ